MAFSQESRRPAPAHAAFAFAERAQGVFPMATSTSSVPTTTSPPASSATIIPGRAAAPADRTIAATPPTTAAPIRTPRNTFAPVPAVRLFPETLDTDSLVTSPIVSWRSAFVNSASDGNASRIKPFSPNSVIPERRTAGSCQDNSACNIQLCSTRLERTM